MSYYVPQPIACYEAQEMQGFRKGNCVPYENRVLANGNVYAFTNVMVKRLTVGGTATVTIYDLDDVSAAVVTPTSQTVYSLDDPVNAYEMLVLGAGNWTTGASLDSGNYYLHIESGASEWFSDAFYIDQVGAESFPICSEGWVKLTWTDGRCISSDTSTDGVTPVLTYPDASQTFFMFLQANLSQPEWEYEDEGEEDAAKVFVPTSRKASKTWKLEGYPVGESIIDALQSSALFETVTITFPTGKTFTAVRDIKVESNPENGGCFFVFQYKFTSDYLLKQGCC